MKRITIIMSLFISIALLACNTTVGETSSSKEKNQQETTEMNPTNVDKEFKQLNAEMKDLAQAIMNSIDNEREDFVKETEQSLDKLNQKINQYEAKIKEGQQTVSNETKEALTDLKNQAETVQTKLDNISDKTDKKADEIEKEVKYDVKKLGEALNNFTEDNK